MPRTVWNRFFLALALITSVALLIWVASARVAAQDTFSGEWTATVSKDNSKIQLNLERKNPKHGRNQMGQSFEFSDLQGLTREQALNGGSVNFSLVREAGRIELEGSFEGLARVIAWIENGPRLVRIDQLRFQMPSGQLDMIMIVRGLAVEKAEAPKTGSAK